MSKCIIDITILYVMQIIIYHFFFQPEPKQLGRYTQKEGCLQIGHLSSASHLSSGGDQTRFRGPISNFKQKILNFWSFYPLMMSRKRKKNEPPKTPKITFSGFLIFLLFEKKKSPRSPRPYFLTDLEACRLFFFSTPSI